MKEFIFIWNIENISYSWHKIGESIISPSFTAGPIHNSVWTLQLYPRGEFDTDYFSLYLGRGVDFGPVNLSINFEFSCISSENLPLNSYTFTEADVSFSMTSGFGHPRFVRCHEVFIKRKDLYLPRDVLTLRCRMWKDEGIVKEFGQSVGHTRLQIERILLMENTNPKFADENIVYIHSKRQNKSLISISILHCEDSIKIVINPTNVEYIKFSVLKLSFYNKTIRKILCEHVSSWLGAPRQEFWRLQLEAGNEDSVQNNVELLGEFVYSNGEVTKHLENNYPYSSRLPELVSKYISSHIPSGNLSDSPGISQNLWNLYVEHVLCDFEIKTRTSSLFVHKIVLCARSPVFLAMLTGDMKEKRNECVEINDIADNILEKFLLFLYTDSFENLEWEAAISLYYAADKYQVERLKILCCSYLLKNVDVDNVCELLMLADEHHDSCFKSRVEDFILQNDEKIFRSSTWKQFVDEQPFLPAKTMLLKYDEERADFPFKLVEDLTDKETEDKQNIDNPSPI
ncbi:Speckle-type POZ protein [Araneus ventricosus]|uniref:Speckle-type POZ protein n=1 Tax=Araneus ventricosus TaxID=182803 RepID=A0A4Y2F5V9_ARAVE|nr:Speckle-type POZ protein [Araneus ventricosus]